ncbi:MAG: hypothetical protein MUF04_02305 [Akkermansiaceae bacterium]|jgi:hypothetical protein|nr:hypothetical protein [Akkermansiaceae bacterium]
MKHASLTALACALTVAARAAIVVPGADGSDGVLNITTNTEIDLSQAVTGTWDQNNAANAGKGVYDPAKWAIVFKYSSVNVASGATVTFKNHASRAPVVWLVNGNVTIAGTVSLDGQGWMYAPLLAEPGPGGFRGGNGYYSAYVGASAGFGIGAGSSAGNGAGYGQQANGPSYGNPSLIPLVGGSGGGGWYNRANGGGGGGGAILIAATGTVSCSGTIRSNGGNSDGTNSYGWCGAGSGGGIRVICDTVVGQGVINAIGGVGSNSPGSVGRIRIERIVNNNALQIVPDPSIVPLTAGSTALLWPPTGAPEVKIVSVGNVNAPADPRASFGSAGADVALPQTSSTQAIIETKNVEQASVVKVRVTPRSNADATVITAALQSVVSTDPLVIRWTATLPVNTGYSALQVHVVRP